MSQALNCQECHQTFAASPQDEKFAALAEAFPDCHCQPCSFSVHSPGLVANDEVVARLIFSPQHLDPKTGEIMPNAFQDVFNKGLSVNRRNFMTAAELHALGTQIVQDKIEIDRAAGKNIKRSYLGFIQTNVGDVRGLTFEERKSFCVYDTAKGDDISHADIAGARTLNKADRAERRVELLAIFSALSAP